MSGASLLQAELCGRVDILVRFELSLELGRLLIVNIRQEIDIDKLIYYLSPVYVRIGVLNTSPSPAAGRDIPSQTLTKT